MNVQCSKLQSSVLRDGDIRKRRRKPHQKSRFRSLREEEQGPPSRTRASLKRKLQQDVITIPTTKQQGKKKPNQDEQSGSGDQPLVASSIESVPEKKILELIIDTLQRRDTYEIFAEPVDPEEVEDYYEIIKEPMDFGTMRAKLHEGMYTSLEQFEHDVFLISGNAMHFNSSATIFFRQARAIHELSKKVFHVLRTDPENFVLEFSGTRQRSCRREKVEARDLSCKSFPTNIRPKNATIDASTSKAVPCSLTSASIFTSIQKTPGFHAKPPRRDYDFDGKKSSCIEAERRFTYRSQMFPDNEISKTLTHVNQQELSYGESLMLFVKDLGPTARMVAKRKLKGLFGDIKACQQAQRSSTLPPTSQNPTSLPSSETRPSVSGTNALFDNLSRKLFNPIPSPRTGNDEIDLTKADDDEKGRGDISRRDKAGIQEREKSKTNATQNEKTDSPFSWHSRNIDQPNGPVSHCQRSRPGPAVSRFSFDLPFLKSQLGKMNKTGQNEKISVRGSKPKNDQPDQYPKGWKKDLSFTQQLEQRSWGFCNNNKEDTSTTRTDHLALQL